MVKRVRLKKAALKKASVAFRSSLALARATDLFVDLHDKIQTFVLNDLAAYVDMGSLKLDAPLPKPINTVKVMVVLVSDFRKAITADSGWGVDPAKFKLSGPELWSKTQGKNLSYLIQFIYQRAHDALRT